MMSQIVHTFHSILVYTTQFWVLINEVQKAHKVYTTSALLYIPSFLKPLPTLCKETGTKCEYAERVNEIPRTFSLYEYDSNTNLFSKPNSARLCYLLMSMFVFSKPIG